MTLGNLRRPRVIAHRGARAVEPENTIRAFRRAEETGADAIELDLRVSADGELVVVHDPDVNGVPVVAQRRADLDLCTFAEVLAATTVPLQVELKVPETVRLVADHAAEIADRAVVSSFDPGIVAAIPRGLRRALIVSEAPVDALVQAAAVGATTLCLGFPGLTVELVEDCRAAGVAIDAWPVNDPETLRRAMELGVDEITTDHVHAINDWFD
jgi:glycerophosphoryl diester phosphodiesterase